MITLVADAMRSWGEGLFIITGRASRFEILVAWIAVSLMNALLGAVFETGAHDVTVFFVLFAVTVRRLHDIGLSGWWQLAPLAPVAAFVVLAILAPDVARAPGREGVEAVIGLLVLTIVLCMTFCPGDKGSNRYGEPRRRST